MTGTDRGVIFKVRLLIQSPTPRTIGPNPVLRNLGTPKLPQPRALARAITPVPTATSHSLATASQVENIPSTRQRIFNLVRGAFSALNQTRPEMTNPCWLCLASTPPYYEGIATLGTFNSTTDSSQCDWGAHHRLTLTQVSGMGTCLGPVPQSHQDLCNHTLPQPVKPTYLIPSPGLWWACNTGLTPCIHTGALNQTKDFCVLVQLMPRVLYHPAGYLEDMYGSHRTRYRREPVSITLAVLLGIGVTAGIGTGTTALVQGPQQYSELKNAMTADLKELEKSITRLEESLASLAEVALQNRRGLDLLFLKEGGLCVALREECCFYVNHSGVIRDSMTKLRERLAKRQREAEAQQGWFEGWFNKTPWLTTLISTLVGPLFILLLLLTLGPCLLTRLLQFIRERLSITQALVLTQQYHAVPSAEVPDVSSNLNL